MSQADRIDPTLGRGQGDVIRARYLPYYKTLAALQAVRGSRKGELAFVDMVGIYFWQGVAWVYVGGGGGMAQHANEWHTPDMVSTEGDQSIAGVKSFSSFPVTPSAAPTTDYQAANKKYVDDHSGGVTHNILSATHLDTLPDTVVAGDLMVGNATPKWARLARGTATYVLKAGAAVLAWGQVAWGEITGKPSTFPPEAHSGSHEAGFPDELFVQGLSGLLADDQHILDAEAIAAVKPVFLVDFGTNIVGQAFTP